jgi:hypothetical protein
VRLPKASPKWPIEQGGDFGGGNKYGVVSRRPRLSPFRNYPASQVTPDRSRTNKVEGIVVHENNCRAFLATLAPTMPIEKSISAALRASSLLVHEDNCFSSGEERLQNLISLPSLVTAIISPLPRSLVTRMRLPFVEDRARTLRKSISHFFVLSVRKRIYTHSRSPCCSFLQIHLRSFIHSL